MGQTKMFTITRTATYTGFVIIVITDGTRRTIQIMTGMPVCGRNITLDLSRKRNKRNKR